MNEEKEMVNHPMHYKQNGVEVIVMMEQIWGYFDTVTFCRMNAFKYRMRAGYKGDVVQDIAKAMWYENKAKELIKKHNNETED